MDARHNFGAQLAPMIVVGVGVLALVGWLLDLTVAKSVLPGMTAMNPMTALAFILAGLAVRMVSSGQRPRLAQGCALIVVAIAGLKLAEILLGLNIGIDRLLFPARLQADAIPNRMAPNTAVCFLLLGTSIYLSKRDVWRGTKLAQIFTLIVALLGFLAIIGYAYNARSFYGVLAYIPMALNTAFTFLLLCGSILSVQPDWGVMAVWRSSTTGGILARRLLPAAILVPSLLGWLQLLSVRAQVFDHELGSALLATANVILLVGVVWWTIQRTDRLDRERRQLEASQRESEARYRALFEYSIDAILIFDQDGYYVDASPQAEILTGYSRAEIVTRRVGDFAAQPAEGKAVFQEVIRTGHLFRDYTIARKDGSQAEVELFVSPLGSGLYQVICHDISERKRADQDLRRALEQERQLNELKSRFVSMVSHEFRTPLAVIQSSSDLLMHYDDHLNPEKRQQRLERIQQEVNHLVQMLNEMLIIRKAETVGVEFNPEALDLYGFCASLVAEMQPTLKTHRIVFTCGGECDQILVDPRLLRQAITNLLSNAVKYSPGRDQVGFEVVCGDKEIILHVQDHGIGILQEDQEHLFEVFHRGHNVAGISGTGLGLPIVKQAVDAHGGTLSFESHVNAGTTFTIKLPRQRAG